MLRLRKRAALERDRRPPPLPQFRCAFDVQHREPLLLLGFPANCVSRKSNRRPGGAEPPSHSSHKKVPQPRVQIRCRQPKKCLWHVSMPGSYRMWWSATAEYSPPRGQTFPQGVSLHCVPNSWHSTVSFLSPGTLQSSHTCSYEQHVYTHKGTLPVSVFFPLTRVLTHTLIHTHGGPLPFVPRRARKQRTSQGPGGHPPRAYVSAGVFLGRLQLHLWRTPQAPTSITPSHLPNTI